MVSYLPKLPTKERERYLFVLPPPRTLGVSRRPRQDRRSTLVPDS